MGASNRVRADGRPAPRRGAGAALVAIGIVGVLALSAYLVYAAVEGAARFVKAYASDTCTTPAVAPYGWPYEAVNYDLADDAVLAEQNADMEHCTTQGTAAGEAVTAADGTRLAAWYIPAAAAPDPSRPTVLLVHGHDANKSAMLTTAALLHDRYDLLVMDLRASGRSRGEYQTMGVEEQQDVVAMLDWLEESRGGERVAALGVSGGGAAVLAAARSDDRIDAVIADSVHARWETLLAREVERSEVLGIRQPAYPAAWAVGLGIRIRTGADPSSVDPIESLAALGDRPILFVHGTADEEDVPDASVERNYAAAVELGLNAELRYCEGGAHAGLATACPESYGAWVTEFLDEAFGSPGG